MKVDYSLASEEQLNMMKLMIAELSHYWKFRANGLELPNPDGTISDIKARICAIELRDCAKQLDLILSGEPTEADGFQF